MSGLVIVDFGVGNLHSVAGALRYLGAEPKLSKDPHTVARADTLVLPGVGSFRNAMDRLNKTGLADALREAVLGRQRKVLGICLGMQLLASRGEEDGNGDGLGFLEGVVTRLPNFPGIKVPHVGFNTVRFDPTSRMANALGEDVDMYFVHSYRLELQKPNGLLGVCRHGDDFVAAYEHENLFATQFHPEKSQTNGLRLLSNFLAI